LFGIGRDSFISGIDHKRLTTILTLTFGFTIINRTILDSIDKRLTSLETRLEDWKPLVRSPLARTLETPNNLLVNSNKMK